MVRALVDIILQEIKIAGAYPRKRIDDVKVGPEPQSLALNID
jgi:hypothetical protein